ncbi:MAG: hypothetical protein ACRDPY_16290 [Streptosporangiaceae bacterium]
MTKTATQIRGIALAPGVSRNGRLYSREAVAKMVTRAQARIAGDGLPLTMKTHHAAEDDSTRIVGKVTGMQVDESGAAHFTAELAGTKHGRTIGKLVDGGFLRGVSIRGQWVGPTRSVEGPAGPVETADDLELDGLDYTARPGVPAARIATESAPDGRRILEEAPVVVPDPGPTAAVLAAMPHEDFTEFAAAHFGARQRAVDGTYRPASSIGGDAA